jgi:hypothetical protein
MNNPITNRTKQQWAVFEWYCFSLFLSFSWKKKEREK